MVPRSSAPKIRHSLWHRLLRLRKRRHGQRGSLNIQQQAASSPMPQPTRRRRERGVSPKVEIPPVPIYVHLVRFMIAMLGGSVIAGTTLSILQSLPSSTFPKPLPKHSQLFGQPVTPKSIPKK